MGHPNPRSEACSENGTRTTFGRAAATLLTACKLLKTSPNLDSVFGKRNKSGGLLEKSRCGPILSASRRAQFMTWIKGAPARSMLLSLSIAVVVVFAFSAFAPQAEAGCGNHVDTEERTCSPSCGGGSVIIGICNGVGGACRNWNDASPCPNSCLMFQAGACIGEGPSKLSTSRTRVQQASCRKLTPKSRAKAAVRPAAGGAKPTARGATP